MAVTTHLIALTTEGRSNVIRLHITGKLTKEDYTMFVPEIEHLIADHGTIRVLFDMQDFHGWTTTALWEDVKFDWKHFADIERIAMVGEKAWEHGMAAFCRPFTSARIRYFDRSRIDEANAWIEAD